MGKIFKSKIIRRIPTSILSVLLSAILLISTFAGVTTLAQNVQVIPAWDGTADGTMDTDSDGYKLIKTPENLFYALVTGANGISQNYRLANDIVINNITVDDEGKIYDINGTEISDPISSGVKEWTNPSAKAFCGNLDGNGYVISGLYIDESTSTTSSSATTSYVGLISAVNSNAESSVTRLGIENSYIKNSNGHASALIGYANTGKAVTLDQCYVGSSVYVSASSRASGLVNYGDATKWSITNCYSLVNLNGTAKGSIVGDAWGVTQSKFTNIYATSKLEKDNVNQGHGIAASTTHKRYVIATPDDITDDIKAGLGDQFYFADGNFPTLKAFGIKVDNTGAWDGSATKPQKDSEGNYLISNGAELYWALAGDGTNFGNTYVLQNDIVLNNIIVDSNGNIFDLNGIKIDKPSAAGLTEWITNRNKTFYGTLDGNGYKITGLYIDETDTESIADWDNGLALIRRLNSDGNTTVKNLLIENAFVKNVNGGAAVLVGAANDTKGLIVDNCYIGASVYVEGNRAGGIVCGGNFSKWTISNAMVFATLNSSKKGAVAADSWSAGTSCTLKSFYSLSKLGDNISANATNGVYQNVIIAEVSTEATAMDKMPNLGKAFYYPAESFPILRLFAGDIPEPEDPNKWDGTGTEPEKDSEGNYLITDVSELYWAIAVNYGQGATYILQNDIVINDITVNAQGKIYDANGAEIVNPEAKLAKWNTTDAPAFYGTINGDGHKIIGLYIGGSSVSSDVNYANAHHALISSVASAKNAMIEKLGVENSYIENGNGPASVFIGNANANSPTVIIDKCYIGESVYVKGTRVSGFINYGTATNWSVSDCYVLATLNGSSRVGAVSADMWSGNSAKFAGIYSTSKLAHNNLSNTDDVYGRYGSMVLSEISSKSQAEAKMPNLGKAFYYQQDGYPILKVFIDGFVETPVDVEAPGEVWKGNIAEEFSCGGKGTKAEPYIIQTASELAYALTNVRFSGKYFKITHDIKINDTSKTNWMKSADNKEWVKTVDFSGHIDGGYHIIEGLWYPEDKTGTTGLISSMKSGSVKKLGIRNSCIRGTNCGALVGYVTGITTIDQCFVDETTIVVGTANVGRLVGWTMLNDPSVDRVLLITNCYSKAPIDAPENTYGILGHSWRTAYEIQNSYSIGEAPYSSKDQAGYRSSAYWYYEAATGTTDELSYNKDGKSAEETFKNLYANTGTVTAHNVWKLIGDADMKGDKAKSSMSGLDFDNIWQTVSGATPKLRGFTQISGKDITVSAESLKFGGGLGTESDPYIITNAKELRYLLSCTEIIDKTKGKYYKLGNDIVINDTSKADWTKTAEPWYAHDINTYSFKGTFDGDGHSIIGLYQGDTKETDRLFWGTGLFPFLDTSAIVRNVHIRDSYISGKGTTGAIAGVINGDENRKAQIIACSVDETVTVKGSTTGGLIGGGYCSVDLYYCYSTAKVEGNKKYAFVGDCWAVPMVMIQCYSTDTPHRQSYPALSSVSDALYANVKGDSLKVIAKAEMIGVAAKNSMPDFDWNDVWYTAAGKTPQLRVVPAGKLPITFSEGTVGEYWSGRIATGYAGGKGTEADPYLISTPEQLAYLLANIDSSYQRYYKLTADLKMNNTFNTDWEKSAHSWFTGWKVFRGHLDGDGHVITGLYSYTEKDQYTGFFPVMGPNTSIKNLGIDDSHIIGRTYVGAFVGAVEDYDGLNGNTENAAIKNPTVENAPYFSQCFVGTGVVLEGSNRGGLIGGGWSPVVVENCYAVHTSELGGCGLIGNMWETGAFGIVIKNSYGSTAHRNKLVNGAAFEPSADAVYENVYNDGSGVGTLIKGLSIIRMKGEEAKKYMTGLDYNNVWKIVDGGTPVLRIFENAYKYSSYRDAQKVEISFVTGTDEVKCESIYGFPGVTEILSETLPTPKRYGYTFDGWYYYDDCSVRFDLGVFPNFGLMLYAKWVPQGFSVDFEGNLSLEYDFNSSVEHFRPGVNAYNPKYLHGGMKSMHTLSDGTETPIFLLSYENKLTIGNVYDVNFWMTTNEDTASGKVEFIHANHPQINSDIVGYEVALEFTGITKGEWKQYRATITANAPYILVRTTEGVSLYFDDFQVIDTGEKGELGKLIGFNPDNVGSEPESGMLIWIIVSVAGAILVVGVIVAVVIITRRRKKA